MPKVFLLNGVLLQISDQLPTVEGKFSLCSHYRMIYTKIVMDDPVAKTFDPDPVNTRILCFKIIGQPVCRLADHFKISDNRIDRLLVSFELFKGHSRRLAFDLSSRIQYVFDQEFLTTIRHI